MKKYYFKKLDKVMIEELLRRPAIDFQIIFPKVQKVLSDVKERGDNALIEYTKKFDGIDISKFEVTEKEIIEASKRIPKDVKSAFETAAKNIEKFHKENFISSYKEIETMPGVTCFSKVKPIEKVGLYIPGGTAPLPSTVLMLGIPAKIAGCKEIIICTPPNKNGEIPDIILYAAQLAGIKRIFKLGGAQAIAAMAYGTESIPKVYKIFGPGNQYVTAAKMLVSIDSEGCAIDIPAGPSEVMVIADKDARADFVASDMLSQAEHGPDSQVSLICNDDEKSEEVLKEIEKQLALLPRADITAQALEKSFVLIVDDLNDAFEFANKYAPEHLILNVKDSDSYIDKVLNAGSVFLGQYSCESAGDYASGTNHTLPTYGYAKAYSGISVDSFVKKITFQKLSEYGIKNLGPIVEKMAEVEELDAHKNAMSLRLKRVSEQ